MTLAIDFDGVIHDYKHPIKGKRMGAPIDGAESALRSLHYKGHKLIIHTTKATSESGRKAVIDWLKYYHCLYDDVTATKMTADYYIDDKAIRFNNWPEALELVK